MEKKIHSEVHYQYVCEMKFKFAILITNVEHSSVHVYIYILQFMPYCRSEEKKPMAS